MTPEDLSAFTHVWIPAKSVDRPVSWDESERLRLIAKKDPTADLGMIVLRRGKIRNGKSEIRVVHFVRE